MNLKWLKDMSHDINIGHDTIKLLEENIDKTFSETDHANVFLAQSSKAIEIKAKINKWKIINLQAFIQQRKS